jgi:hypothetical protein
VGGLGIRCARLRVKPPIATKNGSPLIETIAAHAVVDARATEVSFSDVPLYQPFDMNDETATLTVRDTSGIAPTRCPAAAGNSCAPDHGAGRCAREVPAHLDAPGFEPGRIYELKYRVSNPPIVGRRPRGDRDVASAMKVRRRCSRARRIPAHLRRVAERTIPAPYLYDGFNADEQGRKVFDGVMPHIAGAGRATSTRDSHRRSASISSPR